MTEDAGAKFPFALTIDDGAVQPASVGAGILGVRRAAQLPNLTGADRFPSAEPW